MKIEVFAQGVPKGQPRPRAFSRGGHARVFDPGTAEAWKGAIALALRPHLPERPMDGPVTLTLNHHMPRPKGHYGSGRNGARIKAGAPRLHTSKPDADNLLKAAMDAMTELGVWVDDDQVCSVTVTKQWADGRAGALIVIESAE